MSRKICGRKISAACRPPRNASRQRRSFCRRSSCPHRLLDQVSDRGTIDSGRQYFGRICGCGFEDTAMHAKSLMNRLVRVVVGSVGAVSLLCLVGCDLQSAVDSVVGAPTQTQAAPVAPVESLPPPPPVAKTGDVETPVPAETADEHRQSESPQTGRTTASQTDRSTSHRQSPETGQGQTTSPAETPQLYVALSAGVALPQLLPEGTAIGLSVDYHVRQSLPSNAQAVVLVVESGRSTPLELPVQLQRRGTLTGFTYDLKPGDAPFRCWLAVVLSSGQRQRISRTVAMPVPGF